jgi:hypothetical protein
LKGVALLAEATQTCKRTKKEETMITEEAIERVVSEWAQDTLDVQAAWLEALVVENTAEEWENDADAREVELDVIDVIEVDIGVHDIELTDGRDVFTVRSSVTVETEVVSILAAPPKEEIAKALDRRRREAIALRAAVLRLASEARQGAA